MYTAFLRQAVGQFPRFSQVSSAVRKGLEVFCEVEVAVWEENVGAVPCACPFLLFCLQQSASQARFAHAQNFGLGLGMRTGLLLSCDELLLTAKEPPELLCPASSCR